MLQGALSSLWAGLFPHPHSYLLICALCCFLFCCMAPAQNLGRALQGKAGRAILGFVLAFFSDACRAFSTFIAYDCTVDNPSDACYKIKKQSPIPNKINSKWSQRTATCPYTVCGCLQEQSYWHCIRCTEAETLYLIRAVISMTGKASGDCWRLLDTCYLGTRA